MQLKKKNQKKNQILRKIRKRKTRTENGKMIVKMKRM
jgi:hypothetical protein